jgi:hypothetical protein
MSLSRQRLEGSASDAVTMRPAARHGKEMRRTAAAKADDRPIK